jgi:aminopeptidase N
VDQPTIRPHRLAVGFYNLNGAGKLERVHREELDVDGERTLVPALAGRPQPDLVLLNDDDLAYAKVRLDPASLATATAHLKDFARSLPRTLVWGSAWDAARDGETPARGYVQLILANIAEESDSSVILVQLRQLATSPKNTRKPRSWPRPTGSGSLPPVFRPARTRNCSS